MKKLIAAIAITTAMATGAFAQGATDTSTSSTTNATSGTRAAVTMEQQTRIRDYMRTARPAATAMPTNTTVSTGDGIPASLELRTFPNDLGMTNYRYIVVGENLYLVDPATRKVVHIIQ